MKIWWHKVRHWEYWSSNLIYLPSFFLWVYFAIRFRSLSFFKYSNPGIQNGGLYGDSKWLIYHLLPEALYPKTILIKKSTEQNVQQRLQEAGLSFPLIVKPDLGYRGRAVQRVYNLEELMHYNEMITENYLIQELSLLPNELGLFYVRLPDEKKGRITGLTMKQFLSVTGNGKSTLRQLLELNPRAEMQIPKLENQFNMEMVLAEGEPLCVVPYGNHSRGTTFLNGKEHISLTLEETFDKLLSAIPGFNYGRLDIRYDTLQDLEEGKNFCIMELNGAKSEPTHIYDPQQSFLFAQREIFRHQFIFQKIIKQHMKNKKQLDV